MSCVAVVNAEKDAECSIIQGAMTLGRTADNVCGFVWISYKVRVLSFEQASPAFCWLYAGFIWTVNRVSFTEAFVCWKSDRREGIGGEGEEGKDGRNFFLHDAQVGPTAPVSSPASALPMVASADRIVENMKN